MITAVDTNILLDVLLPDAPHGDSSTLAITQAQMSGAVIISEAVYAELAPRFSEYEELEKFLDRTRIRLVASESEALFVAGQAWREYTSRRPQGLVCAQCGSRQTVECGECGAALRARQHLLSDFLIGAHAATHGDVLLTRDRGFYGTYFSELRLA